MTRTLRRPIFTMAAIIIAAMWFASAAQAQLACEPRDSVIKTLGEKYGEVRRGAGLAGPTVIFEIWASEKTGTWTVLRTTPDGIACVMAAGYGWQDDTATVKPMAGEPV